MPPVITPSPRKISCKVLAYCLTFSTSPAPTALPMTMDEAADKPNTATVMTEKKVLATL